MIWKRQATLEQLNRLGEGNMVGLLDIRFETFTDDTLEAPCRWMAAHSSRLACCTAGVGGAGGDAGVGGGLSVQRRRTEGGGAGG